MVVSAVFEAVERQGDHTFLLVRVAQFSNLHCHPKFFMSTTGTQYIVFFFIINTICSNCTHFINIYMLASISP